jgi:hypothetical protein
MPRPGVPSVAENEPERLMSDARAGVGDKTNKHNRIRIPIDIVRPPG